MTTTTAPPRSPAAPPRPSLTDQLDRQRAFWRRVRRVVVAVLVVAVVTTAVWLVYFSHVLEARRVTVTGAGQQTTQRVTATAAVPLGVPLAREDLDAIARRTTTLPEISGARVTRVWPNTVQVAVTERQPLLAVARPDGYLVVDKDGVGFAVRGAVPEGVIRVEADSTDRPVLVELGAVALALPPDVRDQVKTIVAGTRDDITLELDSGLVVRWGSSADSALKAQVATALLDRDPKTSIDVSSPHNPAMR